MVHPNRIECTFYAPAVWSVQSHSFDCTFYAPAVWNVPSRSGNGTFYVRSWTMRTDFVLRPPVSCYFAA
jgi:hypothetical protein